MFILYNHSTKKKRHNYAFISAFLLTIGACIVHVLEKQFNDVFIIKPQSQCCCG